MSNLPAYTLPLLLVLLGLNTWSECLYALSKSDNDQMASSFAIYTLSRGKGVPEAARTLLNKSVELINALKQKGHAINTTTTRIGLEGESRFCVEFADTKLAKTTLQQVQTLAQGIDLINVVEESCNSRK